MQHIRQAPDERVLVGIETSTWFGPIATVAAAARLFRLPVLQTQNALSIASSHATGFMEQLGSDAHFIQTGAIQWAGVVSAILAKEGCTGSPDVLETGGQELSQQPAGVKPG